jgi:DNA phosphorothioation-dependent restriction protein DptG
MGAADRRAWRRVRKAVQRQDRTSLVGHGKAAPYLLSGPSILMVSALLAVGEILNDMLEEVAVTGTDDTPEQIAERYQPMLDELR